MTAIDTSKLKEGMRVEFKFHNRKLDATIYKDSSNLWKTKGMDLCIVDYMGCPGGGITDIVFPDLQEQDRVEAWEPGQRYEFSTDGKNWIEHAFLGKHKNYFIAICQSHITTQYIPFEFMRLIPKDPDGELNEQLEHILNWYKYNDTEVKESIQKIKSLLAAKVPTDEEIKKEAEKRSHHLYPKSFSHGAKWMRSHFTKNETK